MNPENALTLAEILEAEAAAVQGVLATVALLFTVVSGYATALYFFIAQYNFFFRVFALIVVSAGFAFLGALMYSFRLMLEVISTCTGCDHPDLITEVTVHGYTITTHQLSDGFQLMGLVVTLLIYITLVVMTLFPGWRRR